MKKFLLIAAAFFVSSAAFAQTLLNPDRNAPLEITADGFFEWRRADKVFIAENNARAVQGDTSIEAGTLRANYIEGKNGKGMEINEVGASGAVIIRSRKNEAYGDYATYDLIKGYAEITGNNLRLESPDQTLTATERFEYWVAEGRLVAIGNAKVVRPKPGQSGVDTLEADQIIATLKEDGNGKRVLDTLEAKGNVVITTPAEVARGSYAIYRSNSNTAEMTGGVKITRGPNVLEGNRATVNLNTNTSKIFSSNSTTGRVRGVFYPGSEKQPQVQQIAPPQPSIQVPQQIQPPPAQKNKETEEPPVQILLPPEGASP